MTPQLNSKAIRDDYFALVKQFPLVSIRSDVHLKQAQETIDGLLKEPRLSKGADAYLDALSDLVQVYESATVEFPASSDAAIIKHLMEAKDATQKDVASALGVARSIISEIVNGKRQLTRQQVSDVSAYFKVDPACFMKAGAR